MTNDTHITIKVDKPTGISSTVHGSNVNAIGFNIDLIATKNPNLAISVMQLYKQADIIKIEDASMPEEDYKLAIQKLSELI